MATILPYLTAFIQSLFVTTNSGYTSSTSWAIKPISLSPFSFQSKFTHLSLFILSITLSSVYIFSFNLSSEE
jgi:hypothetical protein